MRKEGIKIEKMVKKKKKRSKESGDEVLTSKTKSQLAWEDIENRVDITEPSKKRRLEEDRKSVV